MKISANLGFLWADRTIPDAIRAAARAGFDAVELHWPYAEDRAAIRDALEETGLPLISLNTVRGAPGEFGLAALPGREAEARAAIGQAMDWAAGLGARAVHVMAGVGSGAAAHGAFVANLRHACALGAAQGVGVVIEPLNPHDAPGYFLNSTGQARAVIAAVGAPNLRLMFDCYHVQRAEGDVTRRLRELFPLIGHVQFAGAPERGAPDAGELHLPHVLAALRELGWDAPVGAEYRPEGAVEDGLGWLPAFQAI